MLRLSTMCHSQAMCNSPATPASMPRILRAMPPCLLLRSLPQLPRSSKLPMSLLQQAAMVTLLLAAILRRQRTSNTSYDQAICPLAICPPTITFCCWRTTSTLENKSPISGKSRQWSASHSSTPANLLSSVQFLQSLGLPVKEGFAGVLIDVTSGGYKVRAERTFSLMLCNELTFSDLPVLERLSKASKIRR